MFANSLALVRRIAMIAMCLWIMHETVCQLGQRGQCRNCVFENPPRISFEFSFRSLHRFSADSPPRRTTRIDSECDAYNLNLRTDRQPRRERQIAGHPFTMPIALMMIFCSCSLGVRSFMLQNRRRIFIREPHPNHPTSAIRCWSPWQRLPLLRIDALLMRSDQKELRITGQWKFLNFLLKVWISSSPKEFCCAFGWTVKTQRATRKRHQRTARGSVAIQEGLLRSARKADHTRQSSRWPAMKLSLLWVHPLHRRCPMRSWSKFVRARFSSQSMSIERTVPAFC